VTVNPTPQTYTIDIYRLGWYNGAGGRLMQHIDSLPGVSQPACPMDAQTGLMECTNWSASSTLAIPSDWTSGIYIAMLTNANKFQDPVTFVVRDDTRQADLLFQQSVTTYQAYNSYPNGSGKSLYPNTSSGANTVAGDKRAVKVSFDRPYTSSRNRGAGDFYKWEIYMVRWLEKSGYDVAYSTNIDTHANGARILNYKGFLSVGHDEYYSKEMFDSLEKARNTGVNLAFFAGNEMSWQIRLEPSSTGAPNRVIVCYKKSSIDPITTNSLKTVKWRDPVVNRPEQSVIGIQSDIVSSTDAPYTVINADSWIYAGTGFSNGSSVPGIISHEADTYMSAYPKPANLSHILVASSPFGGKTQNSVIYQALSGAWVFGAGTIGWSFALDNWNGKNLANAGLQKTTKNILDTFIQGTPTTTPTPTPTPSPTSDPNQTPTATPSPSPSPTSVPSSPTPTGTSDTTPPSVQFTAPTDGATLPRNTTITMQATASDNIGVTKVEFYTNSTLRCTDVVAPYTCNWKTPDKTGISRTFVAKAYDAAGNTNSQTITVRIQ
jgi:Bacterial Ig domain